MLTTLRAVGGGPDGEPITTEFEYAEERGIDDVGRRLISIVRRD